MLLALSSMPVRSSASTARSVASRLASREPYVDADEHVLEHGQALEWARYLGRCAPIRRDSGGGAAVG